MFSTTKLLRLASTHHGMRRILKRPIAVDEFVKNAIRTGVYLGADEDRTTVERRHRRQEYPDEYQILTLHPPLPQPPRVPLRYQRKVKHMMEQQKGNSRSTPESRQRAAMQSYLARNTRKEHSTTTTTEQSVDDYYRALLGIPAPPPTTVMGQKSTLVNKAYAFAVKQEEVMRSGGDGMNEEESLQIVEQLLREEAQQERHESRKVQQEVQEWRRKEQEAAASAKKDEPDDDMTMNTDVDMSDSTTLLDSFSSTNHQNDDNDDESSTPSILHSRPRTIQGMAIWSKKLAAVPYREWTIGASVALDHFVARSILELSEETWLALLEGDGGGDIKSIGQDVVLTRQALFPETLQVQTEDEDEDGARDATAILDDVMNVGDKSIDELLASLGGDSLMEDDDDDDNDKDSFLWTNSGEESTTDQLVDELQEWRQRHVNQAYDDWSDETKADFQEWMESYVATLMGDDDNDDDGATVDWEETRRALLDAPPMTRQDNEEFWNAIRDETQAEIWLSTLQQKQGDGGVLAPFWKLPHGEQVQRLVALTQLRPIVDEYSTTTTREAFMERHAHKLLEGLDLEHLVLDSNGPISGADLLKKWSNNHAAHASATSDDNDIKETDRFSVVTMPYDGSRRKSRAMLEAWNSFKVGRAQYEEHLYKSGKLGLRYSDKMLLKKDNDDDEEE